MHGLVADSEWRATLAPRVSGSACANAVDESMSERRQEELKKVRSCSLRIRYSSCSKRISTVDLFLSMAMWRLQIAAGFTWPLCMIHIFLVVLAKLSASRMRFLVDALADV